jgi:hypothetical protein
MTPSTKRRVFWASPVTRLKIEFEPWASKEAEAEMLELGVELLAEVGDDLALGEAGGGGAVGEGEAGAEDAWTTMPRDRTVTTRSGTSPRRGPAEGVGGGRLDGSRAWRMTSMTTPRSWRPARPRRGRRR